MKNEPSANALCENKTIDFEKKIPTFEDEFLRTSQK